MGSGLGLGSGLGAGFICIMSASQGPDANARVSMRTWDLRGGGGRRGERGWRRRWGWGGGRRRFASHISQQHAVVSQMSRLVSLRTPSRGRGVAAPPPRAPCTPPAPPSLPAHSAPQPQTGVTRMPRAGRGASRVTAAVRAGCAQCKARGWGVFLRATYPRSDLIAGTKKLPPVASTPKKAYTIVPVRMAPMALRAGQRYARRCGGQRAWALCAPPRDQSSGG